MAGWWVWHTIRYTPGARASKVTSVKALASR